MLAIGRLTDTASGADLGTVFACTTSLALTAFHCVGDRNTGIVQYPRVRCKWGDQVLDAVVQDTDRDNDVALLRLGRSLQTGLEPVRLAAAVEDHAPFTAPGAPMSISGVIGFAVSGEITWTQGNLSDGTAVIQLSCRESAAGLSLHGLSGAPVLVGQPPQAVGIVRWNQPREDHPELAAGASIFAAPASAVLRRWPDLSTLVATSPERAALVRQLARRQSTTQSSLESELMSLLQGEDTGLTKQDLERLDSKALHVQPGLAVVEVRTDLRNDEAVSEAERQLDRHMQLYSRLNGKRYVGILTDGAIWHLYRLAERKAVRIDGASHYVDYNSPDAEALLSWLEEIFATRQRIRPLPDTISKKLGSASPSYVLNKLELVQIYDRYRDLPNVRVRRDMWAKLLTTASGENFSDDDDLFIDHTLLALMAEVIGHAVLDFHPERATLSAADLVSGTEFSNASITGVIEPDFFDWIAYVPRGDEFVKDLARRLTRFRWSQVEHDVMKVLYESIIPPAVRHRLGEYYTPDWLAEEIVRECVTDPLNQSVLDASCGSGTFLFHAIRGFMKAAHDVGIETSDAISRVVERIRGFDVHPVAVTLARVTYLLAIGMEALADDDRPAFAVPVYLCDSLRWGQQDTLWSYNGLSVRTKPSHSDLLYDPEFGDDDEFSERLKFPDRVLENADTFDRLVSALAKSAVKSERRFTVAHLRATFRQFAVHADDWPILEQTFANMRELHRQGRDHIWGYYVRNLARPVWLARPDHRVDVLVGNPPWLAYRYMTDVQKKSFRTMSIERNLWSSAALATSQDLAALFVVRCVELYLRSSGRFGYVMPHAALTLDHYRGFRSGSYPVQAEHVQIAFEEPWDLHRIKPSFFTQSVCAIFGRRATSDDGARKLDQTPEVWSGRFNTKRSSRPEARQSIVRRPGEPVPVDRPSLYADRFFEGASVVPQLLFLVERKPPGPLGAGAGRRAISSRRSSNEHPPWKGLASLDGVVEKRFLHRLYLGRSILPFRSLEPDHAVIPWDGRTLLTVEEIGEHSGLFDWWHRAEQVWNDHRTNRNLSLFGRLNFGNNLSRQLPPSPLRVVSPKSAMYPATAIIQGGKALIDQQLYWGAVETLDEARYLTAILNSRVIGLAAQPLQPRGQHNPRDLCRYAFKLSIPLFDPTDEMHQELVELAERSETVASNVDLPAVRFESQRRQIREALLEDGVAIDVDARVKELLG